MLLLHLFEPVEEDFDYKVIVTNKKSRAGTIASFHEGRGYQERIFGEIKSQTQMDYVPARRRVANEVYLQCSVLAHNLGRELQMRVSKPVRTTNARRTVLWIFEELSTLRAKFIQRAGRLTRPKGRLTPTLGINQRLQDAILLFLAT